MNTELAHENKEMNKEYNLVKIKLQHFISKAICGKGMEKGEVNICCQGRAKFYEGNESPHRS